MAVKAIIIFFVLAIWSIIIGRIVDSSRIRARKDKEEHYNSDEFEYLGVRYRKIEAECIDMRESSAVEDDERWQSAKESLEAYSGILQNEVNRLADQLHTPSRRVAIFRYVINGNTYTTEGIIPFRFTSEDSGLPSIGDKVELYVNESDPKDTLVTKPLPVGIEKSVRLRDNGIAFASAGIVLAMLIAFPLTLIGVEWMDTLACWIFAGVFAVAYIVVVLIMPFVYIRMRGKIQETHDNWPEVDYEVEYFEIRKAISDEVAPYLTLMRLRFPQIGECKTIKTYSPMNRIAIQRMHVRMNPGNHRKISIDEVI